MERVQIGNAELWHGDCLTSLQFLANESVQCCITSPPYFGLRDYGCAPSIWPAIEYSPISGMPAVSIPAMECCLGLEPTPESFVAHIVLVFREVRRGLAADGTLWLNFGDSYVAPRGNSDEKPGMDNKAANGNNGFAYKGNKATGGLKKKDLIGIPWRVAFALQADGWYLRQDIIWNKPNPMPESVTDRCTKAHEYIFLFSKSERYYYDHEAVKEPALRPEGAGNKSHKGKTAYEDGDEKMRTKVGLTEIGPRDTRNKRSVWSITTKPYKGAHFATFPPDLVEPCILAGSYTGATVLDPFNGSGTTGLVALKHDRKYIGMEINSEYVALTVPRFELEQQQGKLF